MKNKLLLSVLSLSLVLAVYHMQNYRYKYKKYQKRTKAYSQQITKYKGLYNKALGEVGFFPNELTYFKQLAAYLDYPLNDELSKRDIVKLMAFLNIFYNSRQPPTKFGDNFYTPLSSLRTKTFLKRDPAARKIPVVAIDANNIAVNIDSNSRFYRYEIVNRGQRKQIGPILYQKTLWDSIEHIISSNKWDEIEDELARAKAVWRFLAENRYHFYPATGGVEEHDIVKYFSVYGYGFCDDSARIYDQITRRLGLKSRMWHLTGHIVSEVYVNDKWRLFDTDGQVYFHEKGDVNAVYGVTELNTAKAFDHYVSLTKENDFHKKYKDLFVSQDNNTKFDGEDFSGHKIRYALRPLEKIVFANYNWGKYYLARYPSTVPKYYNGYYEYLLNPDDADQITQGLQISKSEQNILVHNPTDKDASIIWEFSSPFPLLGGAIKAEVEKANGAIVLEFKDIDNTIEFSLNRTVNISTDHVFRIFDMSPTYKYRLRLIIPVNATITWKKILVVSDFQFGEMALLQLKPGRNTMKVFHPESDGNFQLQISTFSE